MGIPKSCNSSNLAAIATLCGVKYVLIETNSSQATQIETANSHQSSDYINFFDDNASKYFALVYKDEKSLVYENLCSKDLFLPLKMKGKLLLWQTLQ